MSELTWIEISKSALENNIQQLRKIIGKETILCPCVKANAYGHGLIEASKLFLDAGADWLSVNSVYEAKFLRDAGVTAPLYILGYIPLDSVQLAIKLNCRLVVYNPDTLNYISEAAASALSARITSPQSGCRCIFFIFHIIIYIFFLKSIF